MNSGAESNSRFESFYRTDKERFGSWSKTTTRPKRRKNIDWRGLWHVSFLFDRENADHISALVQTKKSEIEPQLLIFSKRWLESEFYTCVFLSSSGIDLHETKSNKDIYSALLSSTCEYIQERYSTAPDLYYPRWDIPVLSDVFRVKKYEQLETPQSHDEWMENLLSEFSRSTSTEDYRNIAKTIRDNVTVSDVDRLIASFSTITEDTKRAMLLQLIARLKNNMAIDFFVNEMKEYIQDDSIVRPLLSQVAAATFIRSFDIPENITNELMDLVQTCIAKAVKSESKESKQLIMGSIVTLGKIGDIQFLHDLLLHLLDRNDTDIIEETLDTILTLWDKSANKLDESAKNVLKEKILSEMENLIDKFKKNIRDDGIITADKRIISKAFKIISRLNEKKAKSIGEKLIADFLRLNSRYLLLSIIENL